MARKIKTVNKKGFYVFTGTDNKKYRLSKQEKDFCEDFLEFRGNGTEAAYENYDCKNMEVAGAIAYENLRKPQIIEYINTKLIDYGFNDNNVEKQHLFTLNQFADFKTKAKAIDMFYKLKGKYAPDKVEHSGSIETEANPIIEKLASELIKKYKDK